MGLPFGKGSGKMTETLRVLIVEDSPDDALLIVRSLRRSGYEPVFERVDTTETFVAAIAEKRWDLIISDYIMPNLDGLTALRLLRETGIDIPFIVISGMIDDQVAAAAMEAGAHDYVMKGNLVRLGPAIRRELLQAKMRQDRRRAQQELRASEEQYRSLVEQSLQGILIVQANPLHIPFANPTCSQMFGLTSEEITALSPDEIQQMIHPEDRSTLLQQLRELPEGALPSSRMIRFIRKDGRMRWLELVGQRIVHKGQPAIQVAIRDITERKQAEDALRFTQFAIDRASDAAFWMEPDARIIYVNDAACQSLGYSREELLTMYVHDIDAGFPIEVWSNHWQEVKDRGSFTVESRHRAKDGSEFPVEITVNYIEFGGQEYNCAFARDITARKEAEESLRREQDLISRIMETSPVGIAVVDGEGHITFANAYAEKVLGLGKEMIVQRTYDDPQWHITDYDGNPFPRDDLPYRRILTTAQAVHGVRHAIEHPNGQRILLSVNAAPLFDESGEIDGMVAMIEDVTEQVHAARALRESEALLRTVIESLPFDFFAIDLTGRYVMQNSTCKERWGDLIGKRPRDAAPDKKTLALWEENNRRAFAGEIIAEEVAFPLEGKETHYFNIISPIYEEGQVVGVLGVNIDITERKLAEEALYRSLKETARSQRLLMALSKAASAIQRARTPEEVFYTIGEQIVSIGYHATILRVSKDRMHATISHTTYDSTLLQAAEKLTGLSHKNYTFDVTPDGPHHQIFSTSQPVFFPRTAEPLADAMPRKIRPLAEKVLKMMRIRQSIYVPLVVDSELLGLLAITGDDLTESDIPTMTAFANQAAIAIRNAQLYANLQTQMDQLRDAQTQLIQSAKLAAVGELAAGVAHELNNPLTGVLGFAEVLLREVGPDSPLQRDLETIVIEARRARDIVRNLLNFARQTKPERQLSDINEILRQTLAVIRYHLEKSGVTIEEDYAELDPFRIDPGQIKQVLLNLITNATRAMPDGGILRIHTTRVEDEVAVSIADTGTGIPSEIIEQIFDPFFTTNPEGTGLGLSVSLGIVQQHGGRIEVESKPRQGSCFTVWLPVVRTDGEPKDAR
jgi:PAS domain S-box-containing protein